MSPCRIADEEASEGGGRGRGHRDSRPGNRVSPRGTTDAALWKVRR